jgi:site-specific DNA recombinase
MKTAAIYARVSSDQQKEANTIASQTAALKEFASAQGFEVPEDWVFEDAGYSGANLVRPGLERIRDLAAEGYIQAVLVHAPDRLSRKYAYQVLLTEEFARHGVETVFIKAPQSATAEDQLLVQFQGMIAEYERAQILERSRRGKRHRAKAGEVGVLSTAPYGYRYVKKTEEAPARFEILSAEAQVVRTIFEQYTVAGLSIGAIARLLNDQGVPTRRRAPRWERSTVWGMLRNPAYQGTACFGKTQTAPRQRTTRPLRLAGRSRRGETTAIARPRAEWIEIPTPALVSEDTFALAAQRLADNKRFAARRTIEPSLVQGMVVCKKCGYALSRTSTRSSARKIHYYRCIGSDAWRRLGGPVCDSRPIRQDLLDQIVWTEVVRLLEDPTLIAAELDRRLAKARAAEPTRRRQEALERELVRVSKAMERLVTAYQEDLLSLDELRVRLPDLRRREQGAKAQLRSIADQTAEQTATLRLAESLTAFLTRLRTGAQTLDIQERQRIVRLLVKEVLVADDTIVIRHSIPVHAPTPGDSHPPPPPPEDRSPFGDQDYLLCSRCDHAALRCPPIRVTDLAEFHDPRVQPLSNRASDHSVTHPLVQKAPQVVPIHVVEKALDVQVDDPATAHRHQPPPERIQRLMGAAPRPKAVRAVQKVLLEDRLQHHQHRPLQHFVFQRRNADGTRLFRFARLGDVHPTHWRRTIPTGFEPLEQARQVRFQVSFVLRRRHAVDTRRTVLAGAPVRLAQPLLIDVVRQRAQRQLRFDPSQFR